jgi:hypothetical protein
MRRTVMKMANLEQELKEWGELLEMLTPPERQGNVLPGQLKLDLEFADETEKDRSPAL